MVDLDHFRAEVGLSHICDNRHQGVNYILMQRDIKVLFWRMQLQAIVNICTMAQMELLHNSQLRMYLLWVFLPAVFASFV